MSIFANSAFVAETPRSAADVFANVVPILQKGVRVPSTRYTFLFITVTIYISQICTYRQLYNEYNCTMVYINLENVFL